MISPTKLQKRRNHPHKDAIHTAGWGLPEEKTDNINLTEADSSVGKTNNRSGTTQKVEELSYGNRLKQLTLELQERHNGQTKEENT